MPTNGGMNIAGSCKSHANMGLGGYPMPVIAPDDSTIHAISVPIDMAWSLLPPAILMPSFPCSISSHRPNPKGGVYRGQAERAYEIFSPPCVEFDQIEAPDRQISVNGRPVKQKGRLERKAS